MKKNTFKLFLILTFSFFISHSFSQTLLKGSFYDVGTNDYISVKYKRIFQLKGTNFITSYVIYHPEKGYEWIKVTATHNPSDKTIKVSVDDAGGGILSHINDEYISYQSTSLKPFGKRGMVGQLAGDRVPNQLMIYFANIKYEHVKVAHVLASEKTRSIDNSIYLVLDEEVKQEQIKLNQTNKSQPDKVNPNALYKGKKHNQSLNKN